MRRVLASIVIVAFAGLFMTSLLAVFVGTQHDARYHGQKNYPYYMAY